MSDRLRDPLAQDQEHADRYALLSAYVWMRLEDYREIPEAVRGELLLAYMGSWLTEELDG